MLKICIEIDKQSLHKSDLGATIVQNSFPELAETADVLVSCLALSSKLPQGGPRGPTIMTKTEKHKISAPSFSWTSAFVAAYVLSIK